MTAAQNPSNRFEAMVSEIEQIFYWKGTLPAELADELLTGEDKQGNSILHRAASNNYLKELPKLKVCDHQWLRVNHRNESAMLAATINGYIEQVPTRLLTFDNCVATTNFGQNLLHAAASRACLSKIPKEVLAKGCLIKSSAAGKTPFMVAIEMGNLTFRSYPQDMIDHDAVTARTNNGRTALHQLAELNMLTYLPKNFRTNEYLSLESEMGITPVHILAERGQLHTMEHKELNWEILSKQTALGTTALAMLKPEDKEFVLGIEFPAEAQKYFGTEWWKRNQEILDGKKNLTEEHIQTIDIF